MSVGVSIVKTVTNALNAVNNVIGVDPVIMRTSQSQAGYGTPEMGDISNRFSSKIRASEFTTFVRQWKGLQYRNEAQVTYAPSEEQRNVWVDDKEGYEDIDQQRSSAQNAAVQAVAMPSIAQQPTFPLAVRLWY